MSRPFTECSFGGLASFLPRHAGFKEPTQRSHVVFFPLLHIRNHSLWNHYAGCESKTAQRKQNSRICALARRRRPLAPSGPRLLFAILREPPLSASNCWIWVPGVPQSPAAEAGFGLMVLSMVTGSPSVMAIVILHALKDATVTTPQQTAKPTSFVSRLAN